MKKPLMNEKDTTQRITHLLIFPNVHICSFDVGLQQADFTGRMVNTIKMLMIMTLKKLQVKCPWKRPNLGKSTGKVWYQEENVNDVMTLVSSSF